MHAVFWRGLGVQVKWGAGEINGGRYDVESRSADNQTAAGGRDAVINSDLISLQLVSVGSQTPDNLF